MVVVKSFGMCAGTGGMAELNVRVLLSGFDHVVLMSEAVGKDDRATLLNKVNGCFKALLVLGDVGLEDELGLFEAESLTGLVGGIDEVEVIGRVFIMQEDEADLEVGVFVLAGREGGAGTEKHNESEQYR